MLVDFKVKNFGIIKEEQTLSMLASKTNKFGFASPNQTAKYLLPVTAIYGPNGSGKSTVVEAMQFLSQFAINSVDSAEDSEIRTKPFLLSSDSINKPSEFEISFVGTNKSYIQYGVICDKTRVFKEWLFAIPEDGRVNEVFTRSYSKKNKDYDWHINEKLIKGQKAAWKQNTRLNASFLSTAIKLNAAEHSPILDECHQWLKRKLTVIEDDFDLFTSGYTNQLFSEKMDLSHKVLQFMNDLDLDVNSVKVEKRKIPDEIETLSDAIKAALSYKTQFGHINDKGEEVFWDISQESGGTRKLFNLLGYIMHDIQLGGLLVIDELHNKLHPVLLEAVVKLYSNYDTNPLAAQLIFTSHDPTLMNGEILSKEQILLTSRKKDRSAEITSISDFRPRPKENIFKNYMTGRYGGIPKVKI